MGGQAAVFAGSSVLLVGDHILIGLPEVGVAMRRAIVSRDAFPQAATGGGAAVADTIGHDLATGDTQRDPDPPHLALVAHERPQFVEFQLGRQLVVRPRLDERRAQGWERGGFFFSQVLMV